MFQFDGLRRRMSKPQIQITNTTSPSLSSNNNNGKSTTMPSSANKERTKKFTNNDNNNNNLNMNTKDLNNSANLGYNGMKRGANQSYNNTNTNERPSLRNINTNIPSSNMEYLSSRGNSSIASSITVPSSSIGSSVNTKKTLFTTNPYNGSTNSLGSLPTLSSPTDSNISSSNFSIDNTNNGSSIPIIQYQAVLSPTAIPTPVIKESRWAFFISYANLRLTICTLLFWGSIIAFHQYLTKYTLYRGTVVHDMRNTPPLYDLFHEIFPNLQPYRIVPEIMHVIPVLYLSGLMIYYFDQRSIDCIRTYLWIHGCIMFMRACSFTSTMLPDASQTCHKSVYTGSCHDLIFSGHVVIMLLSVLMMQHFFWVPGYIRLFMGIDAAITSLLIIITHNHYAVDVLLAIFIVPFVFLAFTRHPVLASLGCLVPEKLLAKSSRLNIRNHNGFCSCRRSPNIKYGTDGYELLVEEDVQKLTDHAHATLKLFGLRPKVIIYRAGEKIPIYSDDNLSSIDDTNITNSLFNNYYEITNGVPSVTQQMDTALENINKLQVQAFNEAQVIANAKAKAQALQNRTNTLNNHNHLANIQQLISRPIQVRNRHYDIDNPYSQQLLTSIRNTTTNNNNSNRTQEIYTNNNDINDDEQDQEYITSSVNDSPNEDEEIYEDNNNHGNYHPSTTNYPVITHQHHTSPSIAPVILLQHIQPTHVTTSPAPVPLLHKYTNNNNNNNNGYYTNTHLHNNIMENFQHSDDIDDTSVNDPQESVISGHSSNGNMVYDTKSIKGKKYKGTTNNSIKNNRMTANRLVPTTGETNNSPSPNGPNSNNSIASTPSLGPNSSNNNTTLSPPRIREVDTNQETETDITDRSSSASDNSPSPTNIASQVNPNISHRISLSTVPQPSSALHYPVEILQMYYCNHCNAYHPINVEPHSTIPTTNPHMVWHANGNSLPSGTSSLSTIGSPMNTNPHRRHRSQTFDSVVRNPSLYNNNTVPNYTLHTTIGPYQANNINSTNSRNSSNSSSRNHHQQQQHHPRYNGTGQAVPLTTNNNTTINNINTPSTPHRSHNNNLSTPSSPHTNSANRIGNNNNRK